MNLSWAKSKSSLGENPMQKYLIWKEDVSRRGRFLLNHMDAYCCLYPDTDGDKKDWSFEVTTQRWNEAKVFFNHVEEERREKLRQWELYSPEDYAANQREKMNRRLLPHYDVISP